MVRANEFHQTCRGIGDGMQAQWTMRNTGSPSGDRGVDQLAARERQAGLTGMAERLAVPTKPGDRLDLNHRVTPRLHRCGLVDIRWQSAALHVLDSGLRAATGGKRVFYRIPQGLPNIDANLLNGIVPIAEPIPLWQIGLCSARHIRRPGGNLYGTGPLKAGDELPPLPAVSLPFAH
jgi:hypothetical protein